MAIVARSIMRNSTGIFVKLPLGCFGSFRVLDFCRMRKRNQEQ
jgi:hypothetical protein